MTLLGPRLRQDDLIRGSLGLSHDQHDARIAGSNRGRNRAGRGPAALLAVRHRAIPFPDTPARAGARDFQAFCFPDPGAQRARLDLCDLHRVPLPHLRRCLRAGMGRRLPSRSGCWAAPTPCSKVFSSPRGAAPKRWPAAGIKTVRAGEREGGRSKQVLGFPISRSPDFPTFRVQFEKALLNSATKRA